MTKLHQLLRMSDNSVLEELDKRMSVISGKSGIIEKIEQESAAKTRSMLESLGVENTQSPLSQEVHEAVFARLEASERRLNEYLEGGSGGEFTNFSELMKRGRDLMQPKKLWVLKKEKFREILEVNPPPHIMETFGYNTGKELFDNEELEQVASSLRFMESTEWMHKAFDKSYLALTPDDFEEREAEAIVLSGKFLEAALPFVEKKRHNLSHLKELGLIFIIPIGIEHPGELIRVFVLYLHYLYEVQFYSDLFIGIRDSGEFAKGLTSLLRGDVLDKAPPSEEGTYNWLIVQRYLAKDDEWAKQLFVPHVNPEGIHYQKVEKAIAKLDDVGPEFKFGIWADMDWAGQKYSDQGDKDILSFDLVDNIMGLVKRPQGLKYVYHQQESLWNHIFEEYMGDGDLLERLVKENLLKGYIACHNGD
jgi:hypothetical protein